MLRERHKWKRWVGLHERPVWYYTSDVKKIADRPHWITISLSFVAPSLAAVAVIASMRTSDRALEASDRALKVSQRAYLNATDGFIRLVRETPPPLNGFESGVGLIFGAKIHNLGNTPATVDGVEVRYRPQKGWQIADPIGNTGTPIQSEARVFSGVIAAKSEMSWACCDGLAVVSLVRRPPARFQAISLKVIIHFHDVFNEKHEVQWVWWFSSHNIFTLDVTSLLSLKQRLLTADMDQELGAEIDGRAFK